MEKTLNKIIALVFMIFVTKISFGFSFLIFHRFFNAIIYFIL